MSLGKSKASEGCVSSHGRFGVGWGCGEFWGMVCGELGGIDGCFEFVLLAGS